MASKGYGAIALTGGGTGALDTIDGSILNDGDVAKVTDAVNNKKYEYTLVADSAAAESSPDVISPDSNAGNKRWVLVDIVAEDLVAQGTITGPNGTTINEFSTDDTMGGNSDDAVPTEKAVKTYLLTQLLTQSSGFAQRSKFSWKDGDEIYIDPGVYHHQGTTEQIVYWDSQITFQLQSGGSNTLSDDYGADGWHYIYLDDSAIITQASPLLDADCFQNLTGANEVPTWTAAKHGWYGTGVGTAETNDRCIFAVAETGNAILEFFHHGDYVHFADAFEDRAMQDLDATWVDVGLSVPGFSQRVRVVFKLWANSDANARALFYRVNGQTGANGHEIGYVDSDDGAYNYQTIDVVTDTSQIIEVKYSGVGDHQLEVSTMGWYFPIGM